YLLADVLVERAIVLEAVEDAGVASGHVFLVVTGHAQEGGVDRNEIEVAVDHHHRLVHAAQHFAGNAQLALGRAGAGDVQRGAGDAQDPALGVARHHAPARPHPYPAAVALDAQLGQEALVLAGEVAGDALARHGQVVWMDDVADIDDVLADPALRVLVRLQGEAVDLAAGHVVVPVALAGGPQRELQTLLAVAQARNVGSLALAATQGDDRQRDQQHRHGDGRDDELEIPWSGRHAADPCAVRSWTCPSVGASAGQQQARRAAPRRGAAACSSAVDVLDLSARAWKSPVPPALPPLQEVETASRERELGAGASELHGGLCGWLAGGGSDAPDWLARVLVDPDIEPVAPGDPLDRLREASVSQLEDREFGFELLLPDGEATLYERSAALFDWCRGFVGAFGLAAGATPPLSDEGQEALADLVRLAGAAPEEGGDEEDEDALAEIEEYVRVAVLLLHGDCALGPRHRGRLN